MARLQVLELPEVAGDDRPPFLLVLDQAEPAEAEELFSVAAGGVDVAEKIGARAVLVFGTSITIPANDVPLGADGYPVRLRVEADFEQFHEQVQREVTAASNALAGARHVAARYADHAPSSYSVGAQLDCHRQAITAALGMDRLRDWDDVVNAAQALRRERDRLAENADGVRRLHRAVEHNGKAYCATCSGWRGLDADRTMDWVKAPCGTIRILNADTKAAETTDG